MRPITRRKGSFSDPSVHRRNQDPTRCVVLWLEDEYVLVDDYDPLIDLHLNVTTVLSTTRARRIRRELLVRNKAPQDLGEELSQIIARHTA